MATNDVHVRRLLAGATGCLFAVGVAVVTGVVPGPGGDATLVRTVAALTPPLAASLIGDGVPPTAPLPPPPPTVVAAAPTPAPPSAAPRKSPSAPKARAVVPKAATPPTPGPTAGPPPRRQPSSAEVQAAIQGFQQYVRFTPSPDQVAQAGDQLCTAFDQGQSYDQVKAAGLAMVPTFFRVPPAAADYVVRKAVELYCPGHASRLG